MYKYEYVEYKEEKEDLVETNLWKITDSERNTVDDIFCQTEDSDLRHVRVYSLQFPQQNQWLNSEVMVVTFDCVAGTRNDTVSFAHIVMKQELRASLLESQIGKIAFDTNRIIILVLHCRHWFSISLYLKEKNPHLS